MANATIQVMLGYLNGDIIKSDDRSAIIATGKVGWRVFFGPNTLDKIQKKSTNVNVFTHLYVRDNSQELYGFLSFEELQFFELLLGVSGVGPRHAQIIIDSFSLDNLAGAISKEKSEVFKKVPGIGNKIAKKIIIDLKPKIEKLGLSGDVDIKALTEEDDAIDALRSLGYKRNEAKEALKDVSENIKGVSRRVEAALKILGKPRS